MRLQRRIGAQLKGWLTSAILGQVPLRSLKVRANAFFSKLTTKQRADEALKELIHVKDETEDIGKSGQHIWVKAAQEPLALPKNRPPWKIGPIKRKPSDLIGRRCPIRHLIKANQKFVQPATDIYTARSAE